MISHRDDAICCSVVGPGARLAKDMVFRHTIRRAVVKSKVPLPPSQRWTATHTRTNQTMPPHHQNYPFYKHRLR